MRDLYGTVMKRGTSMRVLNRARNHYIEKDIRIKEYYFSIDCSNRRIVKGDEDFLQKCDICETPLFKFLITEHLDTGSKVVVIPKRKIMLIDSNNNHLMCCYKQASCLLRANEEPCDEPVVQEVPSFEDFIGCASESTTGVVLEIERSAKTSYDTYVKPFVSYWRDKEINKDNLMIFLVNFKNLLSEHLIYYEEYTDSHPHNNHLAIENKILSLIGIRKK